MTENDRVATFPAAATLRELLLENERLHAENNHLRIHAPDILLSKVVNIFPVHLLKLKLQSFS